MLNTTVDDDLYYIGILHRNILYIYLQQWSRWVVSQGTIIIFLHAMVNIFLHIWKGGWSWSRMSTRINIFIQHTDRDPPQGKWTN